MLDTLPFSRQGLCIVAHQPLAIGLDVPLDIRRYKRR
jgi:hypothetical protein